MKAKFLKVYRFTLTLVILLIITNPEAIAQLNHQWVWQNGSDVSFQLAEHGTKGTSSKITHPGARILGNSWTGKNGKLWLMGGSSSIDTIFTDLFSYNPNNDRWAWESGLKSINEFSVYGTKGIPSSATMPGSRRNGHTWTDDEGNLWLFGGEGYDIQINSGVNPLGHLWKYDTNVGLWTWIEGEKGRLSGNYTNSSSAKPGSRYGGGTWKRGNILIMFGGKGFGGNILDGNGYLNDLWTYNTSTNEWNWISGANTPNQIGVYGIKGIASANNIPGARSESATWIDKNGNLWLFGGYGIDSNGTTGELNDLWMFDLLLREWTWISGDSVINQNANFGVQGVASGTNKPGGLYGAVSWIEPDGEKLWLYGGLGYDTSTFGRLKYLWYYDIQTGMWVLYSGLNNPINFGNKGIIDSSNIPPDTFRATSWTDEYGYFWLMGGYGLDSNGNQGVLSSLWQLVSEPGVLVFNDENTKARFTSKSSFNSLTLEFWAKIEDTDPRGIGNERVSLIDVNNTFLTELGINLDTSLPEKVLTFSHLGLTNYTTNFNWTDVQAAKWYHIAATYDGDSTRVYIDGMKRVSTANTGTITTSGGYTIAGNDIEPGWFLEGALSKIRIWNKALTKDEIELFKAAGVSGDEPELEGAWLSTDGSVHSAIDKTNKNRAIKTQNANYSNDFPSIDIMIEGNEGWRFLGAPGGTSTYGDYLSEIWTQGFAGSNGGTGSESNVYFYNEKNRSWVAPLNSSNRIGLVSNTGDGTGKGILTYIYADDDNDGDSDPFPKKLNLNNYTPSIQSLFPLSFTDTGFLPNDGWNLVSNPYPVAVYWGDVVKNGNNKGMLNYAYIWDHSKNNGAGGYQIHYGEPVPPAFPGSNSGFDGRIPAFQSFWVKAEQAGATLKLQRNDFTLNRNLYKDIPQQSKNSYIKFVLEGQGFSDEISIINPYSEDQIREDVPKLSSLSEHFAEIYVHGEQGSRWMTRHIEIVDKNTPIKIPIAFETSVLGPFTLSWNTEALPENWTVELIDNKEGLSFDLREKKELLIESEIKSSQKTKEELILPVAPGSNVQKKNSAPRFELILQSSLSTSVEPRDNLPEEFSLEQNYPNPFNPVTQINYSIPKAGKVQLVVYDMLGRKVSMLVNERLSPGNYSISFNALNLASGVYIYRLKSNNTVITKKLTLIK